MLLRLKYCKTQAGRFLSHLDQVRTLERAFRRAELPLAFSEGFNPHPKVSYGSALAVGVTSDGEYLDLELREALPLAEIKERLISSMPPALQLLEIKELSARTVSLSALINLARYRVDITCGVSLTGRQAQEAIEKVLSSTQYLVTRRGKNGLRQVEIRAGIYTLHGWLEDSGWILEMDLRTGNTGNVKPEEVVQMLGEINGLGTCEIIRVHRKGLFVLRGQEIKTPLEVE